MKKIAVASDDGEHISHHFGRSRCFLIFEVEDQQIRDRLLRQNTFTAFAQGECHEGAEHTHHHDHASTVAALKDCEAVLCYGMGWRAAAELKQHGIQAFLLSGEMTPDEAVQNYLTGKLPSAGEFCRCHE